MPDTETIHDTDHVLDQELDGQDKDTTALGSDKPEHTVPVSALIAERRHYRQQLDELRKELASAKTTPKPTNEPAPDEREKLARQWKEFLGLDKFEAKMEDLGEKVGKIVDSVGSMDELSHGSMLAVRQYIGGVEDYARTQYTEDLPVSKLAFEKLVASELSPEEAQDVLSGNVHGIDAAIGRVLKDLKKSGVSSADLRKAKEVDKVRSLPKTPGPGGTPSEKGESEPLTGKALHDSAWEIFQQAKRRGE